MSGRAEGLLADLRSGDESRAEAAARALGALGQGVVPELLGLLQSPNSDERWWALRTLAEMASPRVEWFIASIEDPAPDVRGAAALALATHPSPAASPGLVRLVSDEDGVAANLAVFALTKIGSEAVPHLLAAFDTAPRRGQIQILRALAALRDHRSIPLMLQAQGQDSAVMQYWAQLGLERLGLNMVYLRPE